MGGNSKHRDRLLDEINFGGKESPCPRCGLPRVKRTDYIRCCACGINWMEGEPLDQDPRAARIRMQVEAVAMTTNKTKKAG